MSNQRPLHILCVSSYFKGNRFIQRCKKLGCRVTLLTVEGILTEPWARESIDEIFAMPSFTERRNVINAVAYLARTREFDRIAPLDDFDVELAALLREHLRIPGMGETTARYFRDKLAMRQRAKDRGLRVPEFTHILNHNAIDRFMREVPGPWVLKPRAEASAVGIKKVHEPSQLWPLIEAMGDNQSFHLLEKMIPGDVYHVDSIVWEREVLFAQPSQYRRPILEVSHEGGIFATRTVSSDTPEMKDLLEFNKEVLHHFGMLRGITHAEFIRGAHDGKFYFLEIGARAGGANIMEMVEAATGMNLWEEWARIEVSQGETPYALPEHRREHAGLIVSLTRQERPNTEAAFTDPEVVDHLHDKAYHLGLILRSPSEERVSQLIESYMPRIQQDFHAVLPPSTRATT